MKKTLRINQTLWRVMKLTFGQLILLASFCTLANANNSHAQDVLNKDVSVKAASESVKTILSQLEKQADVKFVYSDTRIQIGKRLSIEANHQKLSSVLKDIFTPLSIRYQVSGNYIILSKNKTATEIERLAFVVKGRITDGDGQPISGASVVLKGTSKGTVTDNDGNYTLALDDTEKNGILIYSFVGYDKQEVAIGGQSTINVSLKEGASLDEVVVTGVFDPRTRLEASSAISILKTKDIERVAATSATDLLKNIPGVFVNVGRGEIANQLYTRGLATFPDFHGYYYVSMQEDGLPVTTVNNGTDYYLRADATTARVEALRGGSASVVGANAPGGIFNYISKTGGTEFGGEVRMKVGLEGDGKNPYGRVDLNFGGPLSKDKSLTYNVGGFFRYANGARYAGYPANDGGQIKANIVKTYTGGSLKVFAKILNDRNNFTALMPTVGWAEQALPAGYSYTAAYEIPDLEFPLRVNSKTVDYDSKRKIHSHDYSVGFNWSHEVGDGVTIKNAFKYSDKGYTQMGTNLVSPFVLNQNISYAIPSILNRYGTFIFTDKTNNKELGRMTRTAGPAGPFSATFTPGANNAFPGAPATSPHQVLFLPTFRSDRQATEFMNQFSITKQLKNMSFTFGSFLAEFRQDCEGVNTGSGIGLGTIEDRPHLIDVKLLGTDGKTYQVTSPQGFMKVDEAGQNTSQVKQNMFAGFFGHTWQITPKLNLDWGARYERVKNFGWNAVAIPINGGDVRGFGGHDGDSLTLYDNFGGTEGLKIGYNKTFEYLSFSAGLNFKIDDKQAIYVRFSQGGKSPDIGLMTTLNAPSLVDLTDEDSLVQKVTQYELAYKLSTDRLKLFITPFMSKRSNIGSNQFFRNADNTNYTPQIVYSSYTTHGVEIEADVALTKTFSVKVGGVFQSSKADRFQTWIANTNGRQDDVLRDTSGMKTGGVPDVLFNIAPTFSNDKFFATLSFNYVGSRPANTLNGWTMKGYNNVDFMAGYTFNKKLSLQFNVNNVLNSFGVFDWLGSGGFPNNLNRDVATTAYVAANPQQVFSTLRNMPRAYFLTASYKF